MSRSLAFAVALFVGWSLHMAMADPGGEPQAESMAAPEYRVMSLIDMFKEDEVARKKIGEMMFQVRKSSDSPRVTRTDLDVADYQRALDRLAKEGWRLVTVNKSNYWVFMRENRAAD
ncbi:DUF4177 domain-containing protein [Rubinisphaera margarita]|uniref:DUF4177 domain-containing protein n=1 Tax=Rubinisphaera margarita TaxID=2909586 RepID=UPI001EE92A2C|nr:DUF4177 domain-containing protein [Rubinisphaera margarita]MCG6155132.1 DUF4177 domain-containing protein [Rubinisphaera margarita]